MIIGGFQKFSMIDYPGKISAIIFTQGCNFRCGYCYNSELVNPKFFTSPIPEDDVISFLKTRKGKVEAVVITGGEPTLQSDLISFIKKVKRLGFLAKLDTNGSDPEMLNKALKLVDYVAMDVKAPIKKYKKIAHVNIDPKKIIESINIIMNSNIGYEFRTTVVKSLLSNDDFLDIGMSIKGANLYVLQKFVPSKTLDPKFMREDPPTDDEMKKIREIVKGYVKQCIIR